MDDLPTMTAAEFQSTRERLGMSDSRTAEFLDVVDRTIRHWDKGKYPVPENVCAEMFSLEDRHINIVKKNISFLENSSYSILLTYRNDDHFFRDHPGSIFSARWHRSMVKSVQIALPHIRLSYHPGRNSVRSYSDVV